jgi:hypothetical protein
MALMGEVALIGVLEIDKVPAEEAEALSFQLGAPSCVIIAATYAQTRLLH